jgi:hypothetical protein
MGFPSLKFLLRKLCKYLGNPWLILLCCILFLVLLFILQDKVRLFFAIFLIFLILIGLFVLSRIISRYVRTRCRKATRDQKGRGSAGYIGAPSLKIPSHTYKRPDPLIYSQTYLMSKGLAVTWDNPDILLELNGIEVPSNNLAKDTIYRIKARIWNGSTEAPAVNLLVRFYYLSFGIGTVRNYIGKDFVDLPVKGAPGQPAIAEHDWKTPSQEGHYCLQVELVWPDDANPANNLGQENCDVKALNSPNAVFQFPVRNDSHFSRIIRLEADSYTIPPLLPCNYKQLEISDKIADLEVRMNGESSGTLTEEGRRSAMLFLRHRREAYPVPDDCTIEFLSADVLNLNPEEEQIVTVKISTDRPFVDKQAININAFVESDLIGGVTLYFHS